MEGEEGGVNDMYHENKLLSKETQNLRTRIKAMQVPEPYKPGGRRAETREFWSREF